MSDRTSGSLLFLGTATTLLRYAGLTVLTDPNFLHQGERASLGWGLWSKRISEPALPVDRLPPLDAVVLSHLHGDHFDRRARRGLDKRTPVLTTRTAATVLRRWGFASAEGMATWETQTVTREGTRLQVTALPGRHARGPLRVLLPSVMGSMLDFTPPPGTPRLRVYISGDTLAVPELGQIRARMPHADVGIVHLGGTKIGGVLVTMDGAEGVDLLEMVPMTTVVPVHRDDYPVFTSPDSDFADEVARRRPRTDVRWLARGESLPLPVPHASPAG